MYRPEQGRSGPHSIHDARQHAWALLVFGPGAPPPRMRPHRGQLSDLPDVSIRPRRVSLLARIIRVLTLRAILDPTVSGEDVVGSGTRSSERGLAGDSAAGADKRSSGRNDSLAA